MGPSADQSIFLNQDLLTPDRKDALRVGSQERVAAPFFPSFQAFQEEMVGGAAQFLEEGHRGFQVAEDLPINGDQVSLS